MSIHFCRVALRSAKGGINASLTPVVSVGCSSKFPVQNQRIRQCQHQQRRSYMDDNGYPVNYPFLYNYLPAQMRVTKMLDACNEHSKIIVVDGNIACGKSTVAKQIADRLGMRHFPEATEQYIPIRKLGHPIEEEYNGGVSMERFYRDPHSKDYHAFNLQYKMYVNRFVQMCDAINHVMKTAQGVVLERSVFSDMVFTEALHKFGCFGRDRMKLYDELVHFSMYKIVPPHVVIYLDVPVDNALEGVKKRGVSMEQNISKTYLQHIEDAYKEKYLPKAAETSVVLEYDWTSPLNNIDRIVEDFEMVSEEEWKQIKWNQLSMTEIVDLHYFLNDSLQIYLACLIDSEVPGWMFKPEEHSILREKIQAKYFPKPKNWKEALNVMLSWK